MTDERPSAERMAELDLAAATPSGVIRWPFTAQAAFRDAMAEVRALRRERDEARARDGSWVLLAKAARAETAELALRAMREAVALYKTDRLALPHKYLCTCSACVEDAKADGALDRALSATPADLAAGLLADAEARGMEAAAADLMGDHWKAHVMTHQYAKVDAIQACADRLRTMAERVRRSRAGGSPPSG